MRDRLIELISKASIEQVVRTSGGEVVRSFRIPVVDMNMVPILADHILEDGWIKPSVKLNQILYEPHIYRNAADECRVSAITQKSDGTFKIRLTNLYYGAVFEVTEEDFGKTIFLTKEEAEQVLKGSEDNGRTEI